MNLELENEIKELEEKLRLLYRERYKSSGIKIPKAKTKEELLPQLFMDLSEAEKESVWLSIAAVWGILVGKHKTVEDIEKLDSYHLAANWFNRKKYKNYEHLNIPLGDVTIVYKHLMDTRKKKILQYRN